MGWTVAFSMIFGIAALIPAVLSVIGLIRGNTAFWPAVAGTALAVVLLIITFVKIATNWGGCDSTSATSDSIQCIDSGGKPAGCSPDIWANECHRASQGFGPTCGKAPTACASSGTGLCPAGDTPVYPFCEPIEPNAKVKQPAATWSDLSFLASGLWLLWFFQFFTRLGAADSPSGRIIGIIPLAGRDNPMVRIGTLSIVYCLIVIFMGPPSMWYHASMKDWGGWFDSMSVVLWLMFNAAYVFHALFFGMWNKLRGTGRTLIVLAVWFMFVLVLGVIGIFCSNLRTLGYIISGGSWGILELFYVGFGWGSKRVVFLRTWWLFLANLVLLGCTMFLWSEYNPDLGVTLHIITLQDCQHHEGFPGHALFHILASFSTILTFISFASEKSLATEANPAVIPLGDGAQ